MPKFMLLLVVSLELEPLVSGAVLLVFSVRVAVAAGSLNTQADAKDAASSASAGFPVLFVVLVGAVTLSSGVRVARGVGVAVFSASSLRAARSQIERRAQAATVAEVVGLLLIDRIGCARFCTGGVGVGQGDLDCLGQSCSNGVAGRSTALFGCWCG
ncbi:hypothetical protein BDZ88DRAFT_409694 [Geranomyces variabilis]|nr:hypothetical protein BDZ88DRAFT_409694 [Geranomyces variabilis]